MRTRDAHRAQVERYYAGYSVNTWEVLRQAGVRGRPVNLRAEDLRGLDHDHRGGVAETDAVADALDIRIDDEVVDLGAGLGGPARHLASERGCRVTAVELTDARATGAEYLSGLLGLTQRVRVVQADMVRLPFAPASFTACTCIEALLHVADKAAVLRECSRVLRPGGRLALVDWIARPAMSHAASSRLSAAVGLAVVLPLASQIAMVEDAGFDVVELIDLTAAWRARSRDNCVEVAELIEQGALGGVRLIARKLDQLQEED
ncbi:MAG: sarcosine/dimethylglycine N-methyltransferase [Acidimicrobiaceae bacterium]